MIRLLVCFLFLALSYGDKSSFPNREGEVSQIVKVTGNRFSYIEPDQGDPSTTSDTEQNPGLRPSSSSEETPSNFYFAPAERLQLAQGGRTSDFQQVEFGTQTLEQSSGNVASLRGQEALQEHVVVRESFYFPPSQGSSQGLVQDNVIFNFPTAQGQPQAPPLATGNIYSVSVKESSQASGQAQENFVSTIGQEPSQGSAQSAENFTNFQNQIVFREAPGYLVPATGQGPIQTNTEDSGSFESTPEQGSSQAQASQTPTQNSEGLYLAPGQGSSQTIGQDQRNFDQSTNRKPSKDSDDFGPSSDDSQFRQVQRFLQDSSLVSDDFGPFPAVTPNESDILQDQRFSQDSSLAEDNCAEGEVLNAYGDCVIPNLVRDIYGYREPTSDVSTDVQGPPHTPTVKVKVLLIHTNSDSNQNEPLIIPPPSEKTLVLVLRKKGGDGSQQVIEVPAPPGQKPEVFFIDYVEGENPELPGGISLQEALKITSEAGTDDEDGDDDLGQIQSNQFDNENLNFGLEELEEGVPFGQEISQNGQVEPGSLQEEQYEVNQIQDQVGYLPIQVGQDQFQEEQQTGQFNQGISQGDQRNLQGGRINQVNQGGFHDMYQVNQVGQIESQGTPQEKQSNKGSSQKGQESSRGEQINETESREGQSSEESSPIVQGGQFTYVNYEGFRKKEFK